MFTRHNFNSGATKTELGVEPQDDSGKEVMAIQQRIEQNVQNVEKDTHLTNQAVAASHDLACGKQKLADNMSMSYDTVGLAHKRKRNIPEAICILL